MILLLNCVDDLGMVADPDHFDDVFSLDDVYPRRIYKRRENGSTDLAIERDVGSFIEVQSDCSSICNYGLMEFHSLIEFENQGIFVYHFSGINGLFLELVHNTEKNSVEGFIQKTPGLH